MHLLVNIHEKSLPERTIIFEGKVLHQLGKKSILGERRTQIEE